MAATMTRGANTYGGAGTLISYLHEEALHQQHTLDTWQFATTLAGRHRADKPRVSRVWVGADHQDERPALVILDELEEAATYDLPTQRHRRFLDGAGEPETLNTRTEFTGH